MNRKIVAVLAAVLLAGGANAGERVDIEALAQQSGLTARQVRMVLGAPTAFAEYRTSYRQAREKLRAAIGDEQLESLAASYREASRADRTS
jgi:hypothetical protein